MSELVREGSKRLIEGERVPSSWPISKRANVHNVHVHACTHVYT